MQDSRGEGRHLLEGLYESLITERLEAELTGLGTRTALRGGIPDADEPEVLARHVRTAVSRALNQERNPERRRELVNALLRQLDANDDLLPSPSSQLLAIAEAPAPGQTPRSLSRPATPLSEAALLTNAQGEPSIGAELRAELPSADQVDVVLAFVKWHGLRLLERELAELRDRGVPLRLITTTYMGATERAALDRLVTDFGAHVKVQYDALRTRLHAKAWLFRRNRLRHGIRRVEQPLARCAARRRGVERPSVVSGHTRAAPEVPRDF